MPIHDYSYLKSAIQRGQETATITEEGRQCEVEDVYYEDVIKPVSLVFYNLSRPL